MLLDRQVCDRARIARDARFDGQFFTGVVTTHIYCRPVCPVRPARSQNVRFFPSAAAAERAGFRPCLRCRPEAAPGTPAWQGSAAAVARGLALIHRGFLDERGVEDLARVLGVGTRQITRLFMKYLGATPSATARTRRVQVAKKLLDETDMAITEIAFAAGFSSIRRFNAVFLDTYGRPPSQIRRGERSDYSQRAELTIRLSYRPPFNWPFCAALLGAEATPGVEEVSAQGYQRTIALGGQAGWLHVRPVAGENHLALSLWLPEYSRLRSIIERVRRLFDLDADPAQISHQLGRDPTIAPLLREMPGPRLPGAWDGFEAALRLLVAIEAGNDHASAIMGRLAEAYGLHCTPAPVPGPALVFPAPASLADATLSGLGLSPHAARQARKLARAVVDGDIDFEPTVAFDDLVGRLRQLVGFDSPQAQWVAMRTLGEPDAVSFGAPAVPYPTTEGSVTSTDYRDWRPWRSYVAALKAAASLGTAARFAPTGNVCSSP